MFDIVAKFETTAKMPVYPDELCKMMEALGEARSIPYKQFTVEHELSINNSPIIPDEDWIKNTERILFETFSESFKLDSSIKPIKTKFVGFTKITQK